jgi:ribosomal protein L12E/L44/L45/RPP1/RPP2
MRFLLAALLAASVALLGALPASAKGKRQAAGQQQQSEEQKKKAKELDSNYKASLSRIPDQKPSDPWGPMR